MSVAPGFRGEAPGVARSLQRGHPDCVRAQTAEFFKDEASLDAQFCRREMARALEAGVPGRAARW